jgi:DNA polymerase III subunit epsilon
VAGGAQNKMRQIVLDTETTGREQELGHRIIEIGAIVIKNREITDETFHTYLNPERENDPAAFAIHGLSQEFLADKPTFSDIIDDFLEFLTRGDTKSELIIHNAKFDVGFLNAEINLCQQVKHQELAHYCKITDSLKLARDKHPNQSNSLDALCKRYGIDHSKRKLHGALPDAKLLAKVYLKMTIGQSSFFEESSPHAVLTQPTSDAAINLSTLNLPIYYATPEELQAHKTQLAALQKLSGRTFWKEQ